MEKVEEVHATICSAKEAGYILRHGGVAAVPAAYGARREGLLLKVLCQEAGKLAAWAQRFGISRAPCSGGSVPHYDLVGKEAREVLARITSCATQEVDRRCGQQDSRLAS